MSLTKHFLLAVSQSMILVIGLMGLPLLAQEPKSQHIETIIGAKSIKRVPPKYPISAARNRQEGWAKISFVIDKEGKVIDPIVQDSSGLRSFEKEALRAISKWEYSPATQDGEPIEQCQMQVQMDFKMAEKVGVTRSFKKDYMFIVDAISQNNLSEAAALLEKLGEENMWNMTESAYFWTADALYAKEINDVQRELSSVNRALAIRSDNIQNETRIYLLERRFVLSLTQTAYFNALSSFAELQQLKDSDTTVEHLKPYAEKIERLVKGTDPLVMHATIASDKPFYHQLSRNSFSLMTNKGELDELQIRCANKRSRFTVAENSQWKIPKTWGQCTIFVTGSPNSLFDVVELGEYIGEI